jgi:hypothetical protein
MERLAQVDHQALVTMPVVEVVEVRQEIQRRQEVTGAALQEVVRHQEILAQMEWQIAVAVVEAFGIAVQIHLVKAAPVS